MSKEKNKDVAQHGPNQAQFNDELDTSLLSNNFISADS